MANDLSPTSQPAQVVVSSAPRSVIPVFDAAVFEHMQRIAKLMAMSPLLPEHLRKDNDRDLEFEQVLANAFLIVNQAWAWKMDPFAVAQSSYVLRGKIGYEGKLLAAALQSLAGVDLDYTFFGDVGTMERGVRCFEPVARTGRVLREVSGTVRDWHTTDKANSVNRQWLKQPDDQLIYRATRQWCRRYAPQVVLGVYSVDELRQMALEQSQSLAASNVETRTIARRLAPPPPPALIDIKSEPAAAPSSTAAAVSPATSAPTDTQGGRDTDATAVDGDASGNAARPPAASQGSAGPQSTSTASIAAADGAGPEQAEEQAPWEGLVPNRDPVGGKTPPRTAQLPFHDHQAPLDHVPAPKISSPAEIAATLEQLMARIAKATSPQTLALIDTSDARDLKQQLSGADLSRLKAAIAQRRGQLKVLASSTGDRT